MADGATGPVEPAVLGAGPVGERMRDPCGAIRGAARRVAPGREGPSTPGVIAAVEAATGRPAGTARRAGMPDSPPRSDRLARAAVRRPADATQGARHVRPLPEETP